MRNKHPNEKAAEQVEAKQKNQSNELTCIVCSITFKNKDRLYEHRKKQHTDDEVLQAKIR